MIVRWMVRVLVCLVCVMPLAAETPLATPTANIEKYGNTPLVFEPNYGQTDASVRFLSRGDRYGLFLTDTDAVVSLAGSKPALVRMSLVGQNPHPAIAGSGLQPGSSHYVKGAVASKWQDSVPHFLKVDYRGVYPGVDLSYYGNQRQLEYDFTVAPHANPKSIELEFSGVDQVTINDQGDLILHTSAGEIRHQRPHVFQQRNGNEIAVTGQFVLLDADKVGFNIGAYDAALPLIIDHKFVYSTYFGGDGPNGDIGIDIKVDSTGTTYVTGYTSSIDFFDKNLSSAPGGGNLDAFVMKMDPAGTTVLSSMYFGGSADDEGHRIALDSAGNIYITGYTTSKDFPIVGGFQTTIGGRKDAYIVKLDNAASRILFSSYLGGSLDEQVFGLSIDPSGNIYIAGETLSSNFPTVKAIRSKFGGGLADGFVTKLSPSGTVLYSTYLGGRGNDRAYDVTSDAAGDAYVVGFTSSSDFPIINALYPKYRGGSEDAFVTKLSPDGGSYLMSTFLGGANTEEAVRVALDRDQNIIVAGYTQSVDFPVKNAVQANLAGAFDIFVTKLIPDGSDTVFSTFIGSDGSESAPGLAVDTAGNIYIAGFTSSFGFPVINGINIGTSGGTLHGDRDAYALKFDPTGIILFSTYIGGSNSDGAVGITVDSAGNAYVTGYSFSVDFPELNSLQDTRQPDGKVLVVATGDDAAAAVVPNEGAVTVSTTGNGKAIRIGHARIIVPPDTKPPSGMTLIDYRRKGSELTEAAFPLLPLVQDGLVSVNEGNGRQTTISMFNPSTDAVTVFFNLTKTTGDKSNQGGFTLPPNTSFEQVVTGTAFGLAADASGILTFSAANSSSVATALSATAFTTFSEANSTTITSYLPIVSPSSLETRTVTIPHFETSPNWVSEFTLVNNSDITVSGSVRFFSNGFNGGDPTQSSSALTLTLDAGNFSVFPYTIGPRGRSTFKTIPTSNDIAGYAQIVPNTGSFTPVGTVLLTRTDGTNITLHTNVESQVPGTNFRLYDELSGDFIGGKARSTAMLLTITNPFDTATNVTLSLLKMDGSSTGLSSTITLPARGHLMKYLNLMSGFTAMPNPFQGVLLVRASGSGVAVSGLRLRITEGNMIVGTTIGPIKENSGSETTRIFPHVMDGGGYATQFILFSDPSGTGSTGSVEFVVDQTLEGSGGPSDGFLLKINADDVKTTLPVVVPAKGGTTLTTVGGSNSVRFAHATLEVPAGAARPAGMALLDLRQAGGEVAEVAFPLGPFITDGRVYVNETPTQSTNLSFVNPSDSDVNLYFFMTDRAGTDSNFGSIKIPAKSSFAQPVSNTPFFLPTNAAGTMTFSSDAPLAAMAFRTFSETNSTILITPIPIANPYSTESRPMTIPQFASDLSWGTEFQLINPSDQPISGSVQFFTNGPNNGDPTQSSVLTSLLLDRGSFDTVPYSLAPHGSDNFSTSGAEATVTGYAVILPDQGTVTPVANAILTHADGNIVGLHATVESQIPKSDFRLYAELNGSFDAGDRPSTAMAFAITNPSSSPTTVTLTLVKMDGTSTGLSTSFVLPALGHMATFLQQLDAFKNMPTPFTGLLLVHASGPGAVLFGLRGHYSETGAFLGTATGPIKENPGSGTTVIFPHVLDGGGYATTFILFGDPSGVGTSGTITFADENGKSLPLAFQ